MGGRAGIPQENILSLCEILHYAVISLPSHPSSASSFSPFQCFFQPFTFFHFARSLAVCLFVSFFSLYLTVYLSSYLSFSLSLSLSLSNKQTNTIYLSISDVFLSLSFSLYPCFLSFFVKFYSFISFSMSQSFCIPILFLITQIFTHSLIFPRKRRNSHQLKNVCGAVPMLMGRNRHFII